MFPILIAQLNNTVDINNLRAGGEAILNDATNPASESGLFWFLTLSVFVLASTFLIRWYLHRWDRIRAGFNRRVFLVVLPKEAEEEAMKKKENSAQKKDIKEVIGIMESLYAAFAGIRHDPLWNEIIYKIKKFWFGSHRFLSLETVFEKGLIKFYITAPPSLSSYLEQHIHAEFPTAEIRPAQDYNVFHPHGKIVGTFLKVSKSSFLPLKTYKKLDTDPTEGLLNNLSKLQNDESAVFQMLLKPAKRSFNQKALKLAEKMHRGENINKSLAENSFGHLAYSVLTMPFKAVAILVKSFVNTGKNEIDKIDKTPPVRLFQREEELIKGIEEKVSKACFEVNLNLMVSAQQETRARQILQDLIGSFKQFTAHESGNELKEQLIYFKNWLIKDFIYRNFCRRKVITLCTEELASLWHFPLPQANTPNILWLQARQSPPPVNLPESGLLLGEAVYREVRRPVYIGREDRRRHVYIIGSTGAGKSVLLSNMVIQDIQNGEGVCVIDPHGTLIEDILPNIPKERVDDVVYFDPSDIERPIGLNMLEADTPELADFAVQEMIAIFYKLVTDPSMIGPMFEHQMRNAMLTLMADKEYPGTLVDIPRIFTDPEFQKYKLQFVTDPMVRAFWEKEMAKTSDFHKSEMLGYLVSKVGRFVENEMVRNIIGQSKSGFNIREAMDKRKILLINLAKGKVGEMNSNLLGLIVVAKLQMAALARADMPEKDRNDFYLYIDEFQNFITDSIATILAEARKYRLDLIIAHQYIGQLLSSSGVEGKQGSSKIKDAVFGNVGTIICFRIGVDDAETMAKQFTPVLNEYDVMNIDKFHAYIRLLINNAPSRPFTVKTMPPVKGDPTIAETVKQLSRLKCGRDRALVNAEIMERSKLGEADSSPAVNEFANKS